MNTRLWPLFLLGLLAACHKRLDLAGGAAPDATELLARVDAAEAKVGALKGQARARVDGRGGKGNVTLFVAVQAPASVHLEALDFFGRPSGILVSDGTRFGLFQASEGTYLQGPATAENVGRLVPVALPPQDLVALLLGRAPRLDAHGATVQVDPGSDSFHVRMADGVHTQELWVDPGSARVVRSEMRGPGAYTVSFDEFDDLAGGKLPRKLDFEGGGSSVVLRYLDRDLNDRPDPALFVPVPTPGARVVDVGTG